MFDLSALTAAVRAHGTVARVVIAAHDGSSPREAGTAMLVWADGQSGTIGGGALEHQATLAARGRLDTATPGLSRIPLGPALGQCCGGAVTLLTEVYTPANLPAASDIIARSIDGSAMPLAVRRLLAAARGQGHLPPAQLVQGWMIEPLARPSRHLWIWGAGHVGRALVATLAPLPDLQITWLDTAPDRFPPDAPAGVTVLPAANLAAAVPLAPKLADHLILTYSHSLDLDLCHHLLTHGFATCGLIGSATKWARFRSRLAALGHGPDQIARIACPIGDPGLGKHPQAIAIGVAAEILRQRSARPLTLRA